MAIDVQGAIHDLLMGILGKRDVAQSVVADTSAAVTAAGLGDVGATMTVADFQAQVAAVCEELGDQLSTEVQTALRAYADGNATQLAYPTGTGGGGGGGAVAPALPQAAAAATPLSVQAITQEMQYVTLVTYEGDDIVYNEYLTQDITEIDNSINLEVGDDFEGDIDIDSTNVNATGDGAVAAGHDVENVVTGEGGVLIDGENQGDIVTGDGAVQVNQGTIEGGVATGAGAVATGQDSQNVIGDGNQTVQADGSVDDSAINFGAGQATAFGDADIDNSAIGLGDGDVSNISDIQDSAVSTGDGDAAFAEIDVDAENAVVGTAQNDSEVEQQEIEQLDETEAEDVFEGGDH